MTKSSTSLRSSKRSSNRTLAVATGVAVGLSMLAVGGGLALAQAPGEAAPVPVAASADVQPAVAVIVAGGNASDHDAIVGKKGIEVRRIGEFQRTAGQDPSCGNNCPVPIYALSFRRWSTHDYAYSLGLALGAGGGASRPIASEAAKTWDTYVGIGPSVGASFLLTSYKHLTVSYGPQLDLLFFMPSGKGSKTFLANLRGVIEGELHLGMIGVPEASVGLQTGLEASYQFATKNTKEGALPNAPASRWSLAVTGPQALWDLVTKVNLRYYF